MRKKLNIFCVVVLALTMMLGSTLCYAAESIGKQYETLEVDTANDELEDDEILELMGMKREEIDLLDKDIKAFIVNDLKQCGEISEIKYLDVQDSFTLMPRTTDVLTGIDFSVSAFKVSNGVNIYPTYEFTTNKKPAGNDSFSIQFGDALSPYEYGGLLWYLDENYMDNWEKAGNLTANNQNLSGAEYTGSQLGSPDWSMKFKGCVSVHAKMGTGSDNRIVMAYMYNPKKYSYCINAPLPYGFGISYESSEGTIYSAAQTSFLSY